jgi:membrane protease YdiL (CAAX protease family)
MKSLVAIIQRRPLVVYFVLAYVFAWIFYPLVAVSPVLGLPALFAPALSAIVVSLATGGWAEAGRLLRRATIWRVPILWYVIALGLPFALSFLVSFLGRFFGGGSTLELAPIAPLALVVFVLVIGEELGWRGYAQLELENRFSPLVAATILGLLWGFWHLPTFFLPGLPQNEVPLLAFVLWTVPLSILAAWLLKYTRASVLIATLFHGAANTFGFLSPGLDVASYRWLMALVYCLAALLVVVILGPQLGRIRSSERTDPSLPAPVPPEL